ncbi:MAG: hypothetical protein HQ541_02420 [Mariniphaga sp.]|nr:hypothetical protein [Mariniphaga sp.]
MKKNLITIFIILILSSVAFFFIFKPVLQHPNAYLYSKGGDAVKSYFNFSYYLKFDEGIKHDGINYPYGDHLQYINSHPLYVQVLKFVDKNIYPIANNGVAIMNLTMILSLMLAIPFIFLILRRFSLPRWYAAILAIILLFLTPQFDRILGHFEMVYAFFLPMFWYLLIRWKEGKKQWLWASLLVIAGLIGGFTSAYYASFYAIFLLGVLFVELWKNRKNLKNYWKTALYLFVIAIIPLVIVKGLVSATDWVTDRPFNPYGFYVYHADFLSVFLPFISPLKTLVGNVIDMDFQWEGRAYVGLPATLLAVSIFITGIYNLISKKKVSWRIFAPDKKMNAFFYAAILVLLFAMCIPFKYGFGFLLELVPPVKQFRALGRFTWIFYYVFTVYAALFFYKLYRLFRLKRFPLPGILILIFVIVYWSLDAGINIRRSTERLLNNNDKLESSDDEFLGRFQEAGVNPNDYQAIFFLPYASTCGDKLLFEKGMNAFSDAMKCSYHTGLPLVQSFSPRLSFTNALSSIQMLADSAIRKTRLDDMNEKPLLLVCTKEKMNKQETWLQSKAKVFWEDDYITLSTLPLSVFSNSYQNWVQMADTVKTKLSGAGKIYSDSIANQSIIYVDYEDIYSLNKFSGNGAFYEKSGDFELLNDSLNSDFISGQYEISFWLYVDDRKYDMPKATIIISDSEKNKVNEKRLNTREVHNVYNHWIRVADKIDLKPGFTIQLNIRGDYIAVDDILVKPVSSDVLVKVSNDFELFNNFPYIP